MPHSATPPVWVPHPRRSAERAGEIARALGAPMPVAHALVNRGIDTVDRARRFLAPALEDLHEPREMLGIERAAARIHQAIAARERIFIQGDYDVDGITSTFMLFSVIEELGGRAIYHIPNRITDGYGLSVEAIGRARDAGCTLVVTVDCGITAHEAVDAARALGIDSIITDHHPLQGSAPNAVAVVNPTQPGCPYPFKALAGVGVTFKLVERLLQGRGGLERARDYLDVVALGTIADVVPLVGENRILARLGLDELNHGRRPGIQALVDSAGLAGRRISSGHVAFVLAPRINAAGRLGQAEQGVRLLLSRDHGEARSCAESLEDENRRRREIDEKVLEGAVRQVESDLDYPACRSLLLWSDHWHAGVIGIVASRLVERFRRPALLVAMSGDIGRGSGRSLPGLDLTRLLDGCSDLLVQYGGHAFAAGFTVRREQLPALRERFEALVREQMRPGVFAQHIDVDSDVRVEECDDELVGWIERMAPHGLDNPEPLFQLTGVPVHRVMRVGNERHVRFHVGEGAAGVEAIGFGMGEQAAALARAGRADLVFVPTRNEWRNEMRVQLKLKALRLT